MSEGAKLPRAFGPYVLLKRLGGGGHGEVFLARPSGSAERVPLAIKVLHDKLADDPLFVHRFEHEAKLAVAIDSPHVVKVLDVGRVDQTLYFAMELIAGWPLSVVLETLREERRFAELAWIGEVVAGALRGVAALHSAKDEDGRPLGALHRDVAPKNIMIAEDGRSRLIDLGVGKSRMMDWKTRTGIVTGTPGYMAPEQVRGEELDHRVDLYGIGLVLFEAITLAPYIKPRSNLMSTLRASVAPKFVAPSSVRPEVPVALDRVVQRALDVERGDRFQSAEEFLSALAEAIPIVAGAEVMRRTIGESLWAQREDQTVAWAPVFEATEPVLERTPVFEVAEPVLERTPVFEATEPVLERMPAFDATEPVISKTEIFARRTGFSFGTPVSPAPVPMPVPISVPVPMPFVAPPAVRVARKLQLVPYLLASVTVVLFVVVAWLLLPRKTTVAAAIFDAGSVEATPRASRVVVVPREAPPPEERDAPTTEEPRPRRRIAPPPAPAATPAPDASAPVEPDRWATSPKNYVGRLIDRAQKLKRAAETPERRRDIDIVLIDLQQLLASPRLLEERPLVDTQEQKLRDLERSP